MDLKNTCKACRVGLLLAVIAIAQAVFMGAYMGKMEDRIKSGFENQCLSNREACGLTGENDEEMVSSMVSKAWHRFMRFHFHSGGIGAGALALMFLIYGAGIGGGLSAAAALLGGAGAVIYPWGWYVAGMKTCVLGADAAMKAGEKLFMPGGGMLVLFACAGLYAATAFIFRKHELM